MLGDIIEEQSRRQGAEALSRLTGQPLVTDLCAASRALFEDRLERARQLAPPPGLIKCTRGCYWCCRQSVGASPPEALAIAHFLRSTLSKNALAAVTGRVAAAAARVRELTQRQRVGLHIDCPLLVGRQCQAYSLRPLACRGFNSLSREQCAEAFAAAADAWPRIITYGTQQLIALQVEKGLLRALRDAGLEWRPLDLGSALAVALGDPEATARWLRQEPVFTAVR